MHLPIYTILHEKSTMITLGHKFTINKTKTSMEMIHLDHKDWYQSL